MQGDEIHPDNVMKYEPGKSSHKGECPVCRDLAILQTKLLAEEKIVSTVTAMKLQLWY
jgi:hypothetical protein